VGLFVLTEE